MGYFLGAAPAATDRTLRRIRGLGSVMVALRRDVAERRLPGPMIDGLAYAWVNRSLRPAEYLRITSRTKQSGSRDLGIAEQLGYLVATGDTRQRRYLIGPRLAAFDE